MYPILAAVLMACALPLRSQELETLSAEALVQQLRNIPSRLPAGSTGNNSVTPPAELLPFPSARTTVSGTRLTKAAPLTASLI